MVSAKDEEVLRILDLICKQQANYFQTLLPTIYVISQKQIVALGREPTILKKTKQVIILPVNVTYMGEIGHAAYLMLQSTDSFIMCRSP